MSYIQAIRTKIKGVKGTQKITRAMEMVAASKMRKSQDRMLLSRPYATKIREVITRVSGSHTDYRHPYFEVRPEQRVAFIIVSSDRGLCGSLNTNLLRLVLKQAQAYDTRGVEVNLCLIGTKAEFFFKRFGGHILAQTEHLGDAPQVSDLIGVVKVVLDDYQANRLDRVFIGYNEFTSAMHQTPRILSIIPVIPEAESLSQSHWDYLYEPDPSSLLEWLATRYIEVQVYQAVIENLACEQAARMIAMKNATENAGELIDHLQMAYNKARQAAITKELAEIVSGAEAV